MNYSCEEEYREAMDAEARYEADCAEAEQMAQAEHEAEQEGQ